jgi:CRISPR-associated protein Cas1
MVEASAANTYWAALTDLPVHFVATDADRIPDHWHRFDARRSPVSGNRRLAANPAHAILNYLYALLEAETRIACATAGLDPALGILHTDQPYRDSLTLDVMEAARPKVDQYVIDLISGHHFQKRDVYETRRGSCRINRRLTHALAETTHTWHQAVAPIIENIVKTLIGTQPKWQRPTGLDPRN